jgi:hypothetical protein
MPAARVVAALPGRGMYRHQAQHGRCDPAMKMHLNAGLSAAILVAAGVVATVAPPAAAHPVTAADFQQIELARGSAETGEPISLSGPITNSGGKCANVAGSATADATGIQLLTCNATGAQIWTVTNGTLVNPQANKCLTPPGNGTADGTQLVIFTCNGGANQRWTLP